MYCCGAKRSQQIRPLLTKPGEEWGAVGLALLGRCFDRFTTVIMKPIYTTVVGVALINIVNAACAVHAAEVKTRVVDGNGRPLAAAIIEVKLKEENADGKVTNVNWLKLTSDRDGQITGSYDETRVSGELWVYVHKEGYAGYTTTLRPERQEDFVLRRVFGPSDLRRITKLSGQAQQTQLAELLGGDGELNLEEFVFLNYRQLRKALRSLVLDPKVGTRAAQLLGVVAVPEDMRLLAGANKSVDSEPLPISSTNLVEAGTALAKALNIEHWAGNREPRFNDESDMALIACEFVVGRCSETYTATFHQVGGIWKLRGVRGTSQALMARPPDRNVFVGIWHGYASGYNDFGRLQLNADGRGLLVISNRRNSPSDIYRVKRWEPRGFNLDIVVEPTDPDSELITLENVQYGLDSLQFELCGKGWKRKMKLFNEIEFERRASAAKQSMETILKSN